MHRIPHTDIAAIVVFDTKEEAALVVAQHILRVVRKKPQVTISFATGNTQIPVYANVVRLTHQENIDWHGVRVFHLDEYWPCQESKPYSFVRYLKTYLFNPLGLTQHQCFFIKGMAPDPEKEAARYDALLSQFPRDLTHLGLGPGGHIGYNEQGTRFDARVHFQKLSAETVHRDHIERKQNSPETAITQGIANILESKEITLAAFGEKNGRMFKDVLYGPISPSCPATALRTVGSKVTLYTDQDAYSQFA